MSKQPVPDFEFTPAHPLRKSFGYQLKRGKDSPLVSIVTPFHDMGRVFLETAQSILGQSLQQWEWLIVNDGSNESQASQILAEYRNLDDRIRVIDQPESRGSSAAWNTGITHARCDYILLMDSIDLLEPAAAEKWLWFLETHPQYGFVSSYSITFGGLNYLWKGGFHEGTMNRERNRVPMMGMLRKSVNQAIGGFDESLRNGFEGWEFWLRCAAKGYWGATIPEYLAWKRVDGDQIDRDDNPPVEEVTTFLKMVQDRFPSLYRGEFPNPVDAVDLDLTRLNLMTPAFNQLQKSTPHLLIILPWLVMGGAERFTLNLIDQLILKGWKISIVTTALSENEWLPEFEKRTSDIFLLPDIVPVKDFPRFLSYLIQSRSVDAVLVQGCIEGYRLLPVLRAMFPRIKIFDYLHFVTPDWMDGGFPNLSLLYRDCLNFSVASCNQVRSWMIEHGADGGKISVCPIGVDPQTWKPDASLRHKVRNEIGIAPDEVVLLYAARLEEQKQPEIFAQTICNLALAGTSFSALVAGEGSLRAVLEENLLACGLKDRVHMLGGVPVERMPEIMASADLFFLPSKNEGVSQAIYEAMACGLVVVGSEVGGQAELVAKSCGVLLPVLPAEQQPESYARVLSELIQDEAKRKHMGDLSRKRIIERYTLSHMGSCMDEILPKVKLPGREDRPVPVDLSKRQQITRETQAVVEYLQARQEWQKINKNINNLLLKYEEQSRKYYELLQPKPPSHWFYLWIRQLIYPVYHLARRTKFNNRLLLLKRSIRKALNREI